ncbi:MAG: hypothetical protein FWD97_10670 [Defluviitaleaceae bacterium]|nr:hypothetical protein [Defluviitaleaceae bacterium]
MTENKINYRSMIATDAWEAIFSSITRLVTIEEDLQGEFLEDLEKLNKLAEEIEEKSSKRFR